MKSLIMSVLAGLFTCFSVVFAEEILVGKSGEVVVKSEPWRSATVEEVEAYKTGEEVPVWLSPYRTNISFFYSGLVRVSTNSLVYRDGRIHSVARSTAKVETIFLWYKVLTGIAIAMMVLSNILFKRCNDADLLGFLSFVTLCAIAFVMFTAAATANIFALIAGSVAFVVTVFTWDVVFYNIRHRDDGKVYTISSALFYLMVILVMVV